MRAAAPALAQVAFALAACSTSLVATAQDVQAGRELFLRKDKGNCVACHQAPSDPAVAGIATVGPALVNVRDRFPERDTLREMLVDPMVRNRETLMPPFGKHRILDAGEIERVIDYLHALR